MVGCSSDKLQLLDRDTEGLEDSFEEEGVVLRPVLEGLEGGFVGIKETVQLGGQKGWGTSMGLPTSAKRIFTCLLA